MHALLDLLLPSRCPCGRSGPPVCTACARSLLGGAAEARPDPAPEGLPRCAAAAAYADAVQALVLDYKERGRRDLAGVLGQALALAVAVLLPPGLTSVPLRLVPVPAGSTGRRARGHDHVRTLARAAGAHLRHSGHDAQVLPVLRHARAVADQAGLPAAARRANLAGALRSAAAAPRGSPVHLVVVDDVMTTGATLAEAARALRDDGHRVAGAAVVAATPRRRAPERASRDGHPASVVTARAGLAWMPSAGTSGREDEGPRDAGVRLVRARPSPAGVPDG